MSLNSSEIQKIKDTFNEFAKKTDHPNEKILTLISGKSYSATEIVKALQNNNEVGQHVIKLFDNYVSSGRATLDEVLADFTMKPPKP